MRWLALTALLAGLALPAACILGDGFEVCDARTTCSECQACANEGPCQEARGACLADPDCADFVACASTCVGADCAVTVCGYPNAIPSAAASAAAAWSECVFCRMCPEVCLTYSEC